MASYIKITGGSGSKPRILMAFEDKDDKDKSDVEAKSATQNIGNLDVKELPPLESLQL